jgi:hypothetical protein
VNCFQTGKFFYVAATVCILDCVLCWHFVVNQGPILPDHIIQPQDGVELEVPGWVKSSAKMLNGGSEGQDWMALANKLGL